MQPLQQFKCTEGSRSLLTFNFPRQPNAIRMYFLNRASNGFHVPGKCLRFKKTVLILNRDEKMTSQNLYGPTNWKKTLLGKIKVVNLINFKRSFWFFFPVFYIKKFPSNIGANFETKKFQTGKAFGLENVSVPF